LYREDQLTLQTLFLATTHSCRQADLLVADCSKYF
jgi:hypothetical protein